MSQMPHRFQTKDLRVTPAFLLLCLFLIGIWIAGGASRMEASGQLLARSLSWVVLLGFVLSGATPRAAGLRPVLLLLLASIGLVIVQLIPLPPSVWQSLPGREQLTEAAAIAGQPQPWRPLAIVPSAALNALSSLIVPFVTLLLVSALSESENRRLLGILLSLIVLSMLVGALQFSGARIYSPLVGGTPGDVSGFFANRNHFGLFLALGCLIAPIWAFLDGRHANLRTAIAVGLVLLFTLTILATGSRAGMLAGSLALLAAIGLCAPHIKRQWKGQSRWLILSVIMLIVALIAGLIALSFSADRAIAIQRAISLDAGQDLRARALPIIITMIGNYFPAGSGFGGFDRIYMMHEPLNLLQVTYFNHAHNDFLEIALDGGLPGIALVGAALLWWTLASLRVWRAGERYKLGRLGSAMLLLILIASIFDYPVRTPMMMTILAIAAAWLSQAATLARHTPLPAKSHNL